MSAVTPPTNTYYAIYPERSQDLFDPEVDWFEDADAQSPGDIHIAPDGSSSGTLQGKIKFGKLRNFMLYVMGYAAADTGTPWRMRRINPPTHPLLPFLRARSVTIRGLEPRRKAGVEISPPPPPASPPPPPPSLPYPGDQDTVPVTTFEYQGSTYNHPAGTLPARIASMRPRTVGENFGGGSTATADRLFKPFCLYTERYEYARVTIDFEPAEIPAGGGQRPDVRPDRRKRAKRVLDDRAGVGRAGVGRWGKGIRRVAGDE